MERIGSGGQSGSSETGRLGGRDGRDALSKKSQLGKVTNSPGVALKNLETPLSSTHNLA